MITCCITAEWLTAIGTIGTVVTALFLPLIRNYWYRPKLSFTSGKNDNCVEEVDMQLDTSEHERMIKIRLRAINNGRGVARSVSFYIDSFQQKRADESFVQQNFLPTKLKNHRGEFIQSIVPQLNYFVDVACIKKSDEMSVENGNGKAKQFYKLYIPTEPEGFRELGAGTFIIPVKCYSENVRGVSIAYLKVLWDDSKGCSINPQNFSVSMITKADYNNLKKGE